MSEILMIGTFWFWAFLAVEILILLIASFHNLGTLSTISLVLFFAGLGFMGDFNIISYVYTNPYEILKYTGGFFVIGLLVAVIKWYRFNINVFDVFMDTKRSFCEARKIDIDVEKEPIPDDARSDFETRLRDAKWPIALRHKVGKRYGSVTLKEIKPKVNEYAAEIVYWIAYWPLVVIWFFLHDAVEAIARHIARSTRKIFEGITNSVFKKVPDRL